MDKIDSTTICVGELAMKAIKKKNSTTISKYLHVKVMGKCWHEWQLVFSDCTNPYCMDTTEEGPYHQHQSGWLCKCVDKPIAGKDATKNPNYLTSKSDSRDFLTFCVNEWEDWEAFVSEQVGGYLDDWYQADWFRMYNELFAKRTTLPTAVFNWRKEEEDE